MYQVFCDNVKIADSRIDDLSIINPIVTLQANAAGSFKFSIPAEHPYYNNIQRLTSVIRVEQDGDIIFQGFCSAETVDFYNNRQITCDGDLAYLNDSILRPARYQGETPATLLTKYINQHNSQVEARKQFAVGNITVTDPNNYIYCYANMNSTMQEIKEDLVDDLGGYLRVRYENGNKYIDYLAESPRTCAQVIELGVNLLDYKSNINESKLATRCIPLGELLEEQTIEGLDTRLDIKSVNSGLDYVENQTAIDNFGIITKTITFDDVTVPSVLKTKGQQWLAENQFENITLEVNAVDFGMLSNSINSFRLLDSVRVKSPVHGMDRYFMLTRMILDLNQPEKSIYTFGVNTVISFTAQTVKANKDVVKVISNVNEDTWLARAKREATDILTGVDGGYVVFNINETTGKPFEILVMDTDSKETATQVWRWNKDGFGYSDHGYEPESPYTYTTAITMDGKIVADFIKAGTLTGVEINNGSGTFKVDNQGKLEASNVDITGGYISLTTPINVHSYPGYCIYVANDNYPSQGSGLFWWGAEIYDRNSTPVKVTYIDPSGISLTGDLSVGGTKNRIVDTPNYGKVLLNAYETPRPTFADEGHGVLDDSGVCYIDLDDVFVETIDLTHDYRVFLTKYGEGDIWVDEVTPYSIIVRGTPNLGFDWKVDCIQRDYNLTNMEPYNEIDREQVAEVDYVNLADEYLKEFNFEEVA